MGACAGEAGEGAAEVRALVDWGRAVFWVDRPRCLEILAEVVERCREVQEPVLVDPVRGAWP